MLSSKNQLQEFFQKRKLDPPFYETESVASDTPRFRSVVILCDGTEFCSDIFPKKKEAEKDAARKALSFIESSDDEEKEIYLDRDVQIFIDAENKQLIGDEIGKINVSGKSMITYIFASCDHFSLKKTYGENIYTIETPTRKKDGVDIHFACAIACLQKKDGVSIIVTGDRFADALTDIMNRYYCHETYCVSSFDELCDVLSSLKEYPV